MKRLLLYIFKKVYGFDHYRYVASGTTDIFCGDILIDRRGIEALEYGFSIGADIVGKTTLLKKA
jgi:hypothetical protein